MSHSYWHIGVDANDEWYRWVYDTQWRIVATYRESDSDPKEQFVYHAPGTPGSGGSWGTFGGDDVILRDKDANTNWDAASDGTLEDRVYYCQNWRHDVVAIVDDSGAQVEQTRYSPYGIPVGLPAGDVDSDGDVDAADLTVFDALGPYDVRGDLDLDGDNDASDRTIISNNSGNTSGLYALSLVGNRKGYAGYELEDALSATQRFYHVRYRVLNSDLGRWTRRDPAGYVDGSSLYEYVSGNPTRMIDTYGLACDTIDGKGCEGGGNTTDCAKTSLYLNDCITCCSDLNNSSPGNFQQCYFSCFNKNWHDIRLCVTDSLRRPLSAGSVCDIYPACYHFSFANARCYCECMGDDSWSSFVRRCLNCAYRKGFGGTLAHTLCYIAANAAHSMPHPAEFVYCYAKCSAYQLKNCSSLGNPFLPGQNPVPWLWWEYGELFPSIP